jgi:hypothetical protein
MLCGHKVLNIFCVVRIHKYVASRSNFKYLLARISEIQDKKHFEISSVVLVLFKKNSYFLVEVARICS